MMVSEVNGVLSFIQIWKQYFSGEDTVYAVIPVSVACTPQSENV